MQVKLYDVARLQPSVPANFDDKLNPQSTNEKPETRSFSSSCSHIFSRLIFSTLVHY